MSTAIEVTKSPTQAELLDQLVRDLRDSAGSLDGPDRWQQQYRARRLAHAMAVELVRKELRHALARADDYMYRLLGVSAKLALPVSEQNVLDARELIKPLYWDAVARVKHGPRSEPLDWTRIGPPARPESEYHEDMGPVLWWRFPVDEPPYVGSPLASDWPGTHTHFTPIPVPPHGA